MNATPTPWLATVSADEFALTVLCGLLAIATAACIGEYLRLRAAARRAARFAAMCEHLQQRAQSAQQ